MTEEMPDDEGTRRKYCMIYGHGNDSENEMTPVSKHKIYFYPVPFTAVRAMVKLLRHVALMCVCLFKYGHFCNSLFLFDLDL